MRWKAVTSLFMQCFNEICTLKYCVAHVMYCASSSGVLSSDTRVIENELTPVCLYLSIALKEYCDTKTSHYKNKSLCKLQDS